MRIIFGIGLDQRELHCNSKTICSADFRACSAYMVPLNSGKKYQIKIKFKYLTKLFDTAMRVSLYDTFTLSN